MKKIVFLLLFLGAFVQTHAVLKEQDLEKTLNILREELTDTHHDQERNSEATKKRNEETIRQLIQTLQRSNQNALMLYSQKEGYVFDQAYACHEATEQFREFKQNTMPFRRFLTYFDSEVARYDSLINALQTMPVRNLSEKAQIDRNVCLTYAVNIRNTVMDNKNQMQEYINIYERSEARLNHLNDYASKRYNEIQNNIFRNGDQNYLAILGRLKSYVQYTMSSVKDKYRPMKVKSQWDSSYILFYFTFIALYGFIAFVLNALAIRYLVPKRFRSEAFLKKRMCIIIATSAVTLAIILMVLRVAVSQNFLIMASKLMVQYVWMLSVVLISLLLRVDGDQIKSAMRIYAPLLFVGFIVIAFRIVLIPNYLVNLIFPPLLLLSALWQWNVIRRHGKRIPRSDVFYTYITLAIFVVSVCSSWYGYTLLAVQILIWWTIQLTCILTITCIVGWMKQYSDSHNIYQRPISETWLFRFVYRVLLPWMILASIWISIYWAADIFNLGELTMRIMTTSFIDTKYLKVSIFALLIVVALYFLFGYINRVSLDFLKLQLSKGDKKLAASRNVMGKNVIQVIVWGAWLLISLSILHVSNTWLVVISGGLSTGVGFALKDIIENIYYGISLMAGRVKVGDWIEIDGTKGKVNSISYTSTLIESIDGTIIAFTNSQLFTKNYRNLTKNHGYVLSLIPFGVAYGSKMKEVMELVEKAVVDMKHPYVDKKKQVKVVFTEFGDSSINFKLLCWVDAVKQIYAVSDIMERIYDVLGEQGIQIPFPQRDVHLIS